MDLFLQLGARMMSISTELLKRWGGGTVILSPRDLKPTQMKNFAEEVTRLNGNIVIDPQMYNLRANHANLIQYDFFPKDYETDLLADTVALREWLQAIQEMNAAVSTSAYILPGLYARQITGDWFEYHDRIALQAAAILADKPRVATICLSDETLRDEEQVEHILAAASQWDVAGYYVVVEHPNSKYLVDHPIWLANLLILCSGLKLLARQVIVGYSNHQLLCLAAAKVDAIASGTWLNVRSFSPKKFDQRSESDFSQRATWYYCPQALSEYKITFLDFAARSGVLNRLAADISAYPEDTEMLFSGALPSSTAYSEGNSFRHYLCCLRAQAQSSTRKSFQETLQAQQLLLSIAAQNLAFFRDHGIRGQDRDFTECVDVNLAALNYLENARGFQLSMQWDHM